MLLQKPFAKDLPLLLEVFNLVFEGLDPAALLAARHAPQPALKAPRRTVAADAQVAAAPPLSQMITFACALV